MQPSANPGAAPLRPLLALVIVTLPFMDLEVFQIAERSIVLPYVTVALLGAALARRPALLAGFLQTDGATPFLFVWMVVAAGSSAAAFYRSQDTELLAANSAQWANLAIMVGHYVLLGAALRIQPAHVLSQLLNLFVATATVGGLLSLYQVGSVIFGWPYVDLIRTSNLYFHNNTLTWHGGGSWIAFPRAVGAAPEPTFWAGYMAVGLAVSLGRLGWPPRPTAVAQTVIIALGLLSTFARAAVPAIGVVLMCWLLIGRRATLPRWLGPGLVALAFAATVAPALVAERWLSILGDHSAVERLSSTVTGIRIMSDHPFLGVGPGSVPFVVEEYLYAIGSRPSVGFRQLYSFIASVLATTGIVGALCLAAFLVEICRRLYAIAPASDPERQRLVRAAFLGVACVVVYWVGSAAYNMSFLWFCPAFAAALPGSSEPVNS